MGGRISSDGGGRRFAGGHSPPGFRLTGPAERNITEFLDWSGENFGPAARRRYEPLVATALGHIAQVWRRIGCSVQREDLGAGRHHPASPARFNGLHTPSGRAPGITLRIPSHVRPQETPCASRSSARVTKYSPARSSTPTSAT